MKEKAGIFVTGLLLGALSGGATALFSAAHLKRGNGTHRHSTTESPPKRATEVLDRDQEELGTWSGHVPVSAQVPGQALAGAPLGWY